MLFRSQRRRYWAKIAAWKDGRAVRSENRETIEEMSDRLWKEIETLSGISDLRYLGPEFLIYLTEDITGAVGQTSLRIMDGQQNLLKPDYLVRQLKQYVQDKGNDQAPEFAALSNDAFHVEGRLSASIERLKQNKILIDSLEEFYAQFFYERYHLPNRALLEQGQRPSYEQRVTILPRPDADAKIKQELVEKEAVDLVDLGVGMTGIDLVSGWPRDRGRLILVENNPHIANILSKYSEKVGNDRIRVLERDITDPAFFEWLTGEVSAGRIRAGLVSATQVMKHLNGERKIDPAINSGFVRRLGTWAANQRTGIILAELKSEMTELWEDWKGYPGLLKGLGLSVWGDLESDTSFIFAVPRETVLDIARVFPDLSVERAEHRVTLSGDKEVVLDMRAGVKDNWVLLKIGEEIFGIHTKDWPAVLGRAQTDNATPVVYRLDTALKKHSKIDDLDLSYYVLQSYELFTKFVLSMKPSLHAVRELDPRQLRDVVLPIRAAYRPEGFKLSSATYGLFRWDYAALREEFPRRTLPTSFGETEDQKFFDSWSEIGMWLPVLMDDEFSVIYQAKTQDLADGRQGLPDLFRAIAQKMSLRSEARLENQTGTVLSEDIEKDRITKDSVMQVIEEINQTAKRRIFNDDQKAQIAQKIESMRLAKGRRILICGPASSDYLPVLLAKLGLQTSVIDTNPVEIRGLIDLMKAHHLNEALSVFTDYDDLGDRRFDYITMFGMLHYLYDPSADEKMKAYLDEIPFAGLSEKERLNREGREYALSKMKDYLKPVVNHLNHGGLILLNTPVIYPGDKTMIDAGINFFRKELDLADEALGQLGRERGVTFTKQSNVNLTDFSMNEQFLNEKRIGIAYQVINRSETRSANHLDSRSLDLRPSDIRQNPLRSLASVEGKLVVVDFNEMENPKDPNQFSEEQIKEVVALAAAAKGRVKVVIYNADIASNTYRILRDLIDQLERENPELKNKIELTREDLAGIAGRQIKTWRGQVLHLSKSRSSEIAPAIKAAGAEEKVLRFRYEDETGALMQQGGTLGFAVTQADVLSKKTAELLKRALPDGIGFNSKGGYFYVDRAHAGLWGKIYEAMYVVVFARSA